MQDWRQTGDDTVGLQEATATVYNIVTSSAVVIGGVWAYFKFVRGRTFAHRAELSVSMSLGRSAGGLYLCVTVVLKNTGLSKLPLNNNMKAIRLFGMTGQADDRPNGTEWERILTLPVLDQHEWLEAQETVTDSVICRLPAAAKADTHVAYQVEAVIGARRRLITRKRVQWQARSFTFLPLGDANKPSDSAARADLDGKTGLMARIVNLRKERQS
jgi:hypothetical protein